MAKKLLIKGTLVNSTSNPKGGEMIVDVSAGSTSATTLTIKTDNGLVEFVPKPLYDALEARVTALEQEIAEPDSNAIIDLVS